MIKEIKDLLESIITTYSPVPVTKIVRNMKDTRGQLSARSYPFVSLLTLKGSFDERFAQESFKYLDPADQTFKTRVIRGKRCLPILIKVWATNEEMADNIVSTLIPYIPRRWEHDGLDGEIKIDVEEHSDHGGNVTDGYESVLVVTFNMRVGTVPVVLPTIRKAESQTET